MTPSLENSLPIPHITNGHSTKSLPNPIDPAFKSPLDQDFIDYYNKNLAINPPTHGVTIADIRANPKKYASPWCRDYSGEQFVKDIKIPSDDGHIFTGRLYYPDPATSPFVEGPYPIYINFHGGGFTFGDLTGDAEICMTIRNRVGVMVMDVDYRLAPEHSYGKGHDDAWAAIRWVYRNGSEVNARPDSISIGGISAGGTLSAVAQQLARDEAIPLKLAILAVPCTAYHGDLTKASDSPFASFVENEFAPCLNWKRIAYFSAHHSPKTDAEREALNARSVIYRSPMEGNLNGICDTFVITAACDPLRDEGELYAQKLIEAGVRTTVRRYTGVPHPFMHMRPIKKAEMYLDDICGELRRAHIS